MSYHSHFAWQPEEGYEKPGLVHVVVHGVAENRRYAAAGRFLPAAFAILCPADGLIFQMGMVFNNQRT